MSYSPKEDDFSGIYKITNITNNRVYIGQSICVNERLKKHRQRLKGNYHDNDYLQNSWNKYGEDNFIFESVEECNQDRLLERENYWMRYYNSYLRKNGYNIIKPSDNIEKLPQTKEHNKRISVNRRLYSDEELLSHLHEVYYMTGKIPERNSINEGMNENFQQIYYRRFGGLKEAIVLSGILTPSEEKKYLDEVVSKEDLIEAYKRFIAENERFPNQKERVISNGLYSASVILKYFKGMKEFREYIGFTIEDEESIKLEKELVILKEIYKDYGYLSVKLIDKVRLTRFSRRLIKQCGSVDELYRRVGIDIEENKRIQLENRVKNRRLNDAKRKEEKQAG